MGAVHVNVKPAERSRVYDTPEQAIIHVFLFRPEWNFGGKPFGHTIDARRRLRDALMGKDASAFVAYKRRGYWRVELRD